MALSMIKPHTCMADGCFMGYMIGFCGGVSPLGIPSLRTGTWPVWLDDLYGAFRSHGATPSHPFRTMGFSRSQKPSSYGVKAWVHRLRLSCPKTARRSSGLAQRSTAFSGSAQLSKMVWITSAAFSAAYEMPTNVNHCFWSMSVVYGSKSSIQWLFNDQGHSNIFPKLPSKFLLIPFGCHIIWVLSQT